MPLTKIVKALAPELRDADNLNTGTVPETRLRETLREAGKTVPSQDYNLAIETGFYAGIGAPTGTNAPPELARYGTMFVGRSANNYITQIVGFGAATGATNQLYFRGSNTNGSTWAAWQKVFTQASILGTVAQSGGVPTGAIIEKGSNANGEYTKFADGTMTCFGEVSATCTSGPYTNGVNGTVYYAQPDVTLPAAFVNANYRTNVTAVNRGASLLAGFVKSTSSFRVELNDTSNTTPVRASWSAIGRWF